MRCAACPTRPGRRCFSAAHPVYCEHARIEAQAVAAGLAAGPGAYTAFLQGNDLGPADEPEDVPAGAAGDSRIGVVLLAPLAVPSGLQTWLEIMLDLDVPGVAWRAVGLRDLTGHDPACITRLRRRLPVVLGERDSLHVAARADIVITTGWPEITARLDPRRVVYALHEAQGPAAAPLPATHPAIYVTPNPAATITAAIDRHGWAEIPNPLGPPRHRDPRDLARRAQPLPDPARRLVLYLGRMVFEKGIKALARAADILESEEPGGWLFAFVGDLTMDGLECRILFPPGPHRWYVGGTEYPAAWLQGADALVAPSAREAASYSILEAWDLGVPVVATPVGLVAGRRRWVRNLSPVPTGIEIARMLQRDRDQPERTRRRCREVQRWVRAEHDPGLVARQWSRLLTDLARPLGPPLTPAEPPAAPAPWTTDRARTALQAFTPAQHARMESCRHKTTAATCCEEAAPFCRKGRGVGGFVMTAHCVQCVATDGDR